MTQFPHDQFVKEYLPQLLGQYGELVAEYKVDTCDRCATIKQLDQFGYQKSDPVENIIWFCKDCR